MPFGTMARPASSHPDRTRVCWRCGIDFTPHPRLRADAPCGDCRDQVSKPDGGWWREPARARAKGQEPMGIRAIDRARAAQMVQAQLLGDAEMFAVAVQQAFDDDFGIGGMGSTINVLRSLSESLAEGLVAIHGEAAPSLVAEVLMQEAAGD